MVDKSSGCRIFMIGRWGGECNILCVMSFFWSAYEKHGEYERKRESVCALLLALKTHYGSVFEKNFAKMPAVKGLLDNCPTGRILKLRRIDLSRLAEYI